MEERQEDRTGQDHVVFSKDSRFRVVGVKYKNFYNVT